MTWEVRAVDQDGTLVSVVKGVNVDSVHLALPVQERMELSMGALQTGAGLLDLFGHEVQLWDGSDFYSWFRPGRHGTDVSASSDTHRVTCDGLFSYYHDLLVGERRPNHITSPHEDTAAVGNPPNAWTATGGVEATVIVDNNVELWDEAKAIQVNNSEADGDDYIYLRFLVPWELDLVPFCGVAYGYVADDQGGAPAFGGAAMNERGLMIHRLSGDGATKMSKSKIAKLTDETSRNEVVRYQTPEVLARAGELIEVRLYAPKGWSVWRYAGLFDGRALKVDRVDKSAAVVALHEHAISKFDFGIGTDVTSIGEQVSMEWPHWRRDNIGEQIDRLADTFEMEMHYPTLTPGLAVRNLRVRPEVGTDRTSVTLTKADFVAWSLAAEIQASANRVIRQGEGSGIGRDEWWAEDLTALNGKLREHLDLAPPGEPLVRLRDNAEASLSRLKGVQRLPKVSIVGDLATQVRPGDRFTVDLDHGPAQYEGEARVMAVDLTPAARRAALDLVPV